LVLGKLRKVLKEIFLRFSLKVKFFLILLNSQTKNLFQPKFLPLKTGGYGWLGKLRGLTIKPYFKNPFFNPVIYHILLFHKNYLLLGYQYFFGLVVRFFLPIFSIHSVGIFWYLSPWDFGGKRFILEVLLLELKVRTFLGD